MKLVRQPDGSPLCGQACIAMVLDIALEESIAKFKSRGQTKTQQLVKILRANKIKCGGKLERIRDLAELPDFCIVNACWFSKGKRKKHWVVKWDNCFYDPAAGIVKKLDGLRITSFLRADIGPK
jgi:hypothetical protein